MKRTIIFLFVLLILLFGLIEFKPQVQSPQEQKVVPITVLKQHDRVTYKGKEGVDALTLLQEQTTIEQNDSGLVTTINGRKADEKSREFWSFYVNGKMASVGPKEYVTKEGDSIEWKIETY